MPEAYLSSPGKLYCTLLWIGDTANFSFPGEALLPFAPFAMAEEGGRRRPVGILVGWGTAQKKAARVQGAKGEKSGVKAVAISLLQVQYPLASAAQSRCRHETVDTVLQ